MLIDTHCHIHLADYGLDVEEVLQNTKDSQVEALMVVGTSARDSQLAIEFAASHDNCWATVGLHPHDSKLGTTELKKLEELASMPKVVAIGECGLDYYYSHSPKEVQIKALEFQMKLSLKHGLPMVFHVRDAFADFWSVYDAHNSKKQPIRGVIHSFSASSADLEAIMKRDLYVGLNGIMTFTKSADQLAAARVVPLNRLLLETDSPFLTPPPFRGKVNQPAYVELVAKFLAEERGETLAELSEVTSQNAIKLFGIKL